MSSLSLVLVISLLGGAPSSSVDPAVSIYLKSPVFRGLILNPLNPLPPAVTRGDYAPVSVRVKSRDDLPRLLALEGNEVRVVRRNRKPAIWGRVVAANVTLAGLQKLSLQEFVERVELDRPARRLFPTDVTGSLIAAPQTWGALDSLGDFVTGKGVVVADMDSCIDVFQPAFFFGDGGYFNWIDVNQDGFFDLGTDGVDLDGDGAIGPGEVLEYIDVRMYSAYGAIDMVGGTSQGYGAFQANLDYLYADLNSNGRRDADFESAVAADSPSLGEPFFIADDVNNNGTLDVGEKIIMLAGSKVRTYFWDNTVYQRGVNLRDAPRNQDISHGTGVCGITAGGIKGHGHRWGLAPDAELVVANAYGNVGYFQVLQWVLSQNPDVVIHEYANNFGSFLDGTSNVEVAMDESSDTGVVHAAAAGNHGGSGKGYKSVIQPGEVRDVALFLPGGTAAPPYIQLTLLWRDNTQFFGLSLEDPTGVIFDMSASTSNMVEAAPDIWYYVTWDQSTSGTVMADIVVYGWDGNNYANLNGGQYTLRITHTNGAGAPVEVAGFSTDSDSGWGEGFGWQEGVTEEHLIGWPGTAGSAITVAAYNGRSEPEIDYYGQPQGELRYYSGRGHRIDGVQIMDVGAPANPLAPTCYDCTTDENRYGNMSVFGGTSGATPHVGAAAALLKQLFPSENGALIKERIREAALVDSQVTAPGNLPTEEMWGAGKLRIWEAGFPTDAHSYSPPTIDGSLLSAQVNEEVTLTPEVSDMETPVADLRVRYDLDYDGIYDTEFQLDKTTTVTFSATGLHVVKAQVVDEHGFTNEALFSIDVVDPTTQNDGGVDGGNTDDSGDGGCSCRHGTRGTTPAMPILFLFIAGMLIAGRFRRR
ncbi:S8 family serine peptidase [Myxococcota bacterium]|nr:S8 family serine peptidase [Myxococcota bacterium]MBU1537702.1 S8 family serine peptidase [Myxococcota bacterium]